MQRCVPIAPCCQCAGLLPGTTVGMSGPCDISMRRVLVGMQEEDGDLEALRHVNTSIFNYYNAVSDTLSKNPR